MQRSTRDLKKRWTPRQRAPAPHACMRAPGMSSGPAGVSAWCCAAASFFSRRYCCRRQVPPPLPPPGFPTAVAAAVVIPPPLPPPVFPTAAVIVPAAVVIPVVVAAVVAAFIRIQPSSSQQEVASGVGVTSEYRLRGGDCGASLSSPVGTGVGALNQTLRFDSTLREIPSPSGRSRSPASWSIHTSTGRSPWNFQSSHPRHQGLEVRRHPTGTSTAVTMPAGTKPMNCTDSWSGACLARRHQASNRELSTQFACPSPFVTASRRPA